MSKRMQLTLFVEEQESGIIESIRKKFNPEQYRLIRSHVTLCRENELEQVEKVIQALTRSIHNYITIYFAPVIRFAEGKGVLMPGAGAMEILHSA